jgi:uncharacterized membrane protein
VRSLYNRIAGQNLERLAALSDGVFAVAMTLLVLDLHAPAAEAIHSEHDLLTALLALAPRLVTYLMSFSRWGSSGWASKLSSIVWHAATGTSRGSTSRSCAR